MTDYTKLAAELRQLGITKIFDTLHIDAANAIDDLVKERDRLRALLVQIRSDAVSTMASSNDLDYRIAIPRIAALAKS